MTQLLDVIFEDESLLAIRKPAGLVCHPTKGDQFSSLISRVRLYLSPGASPQLIHRLDRETSGVVLVAKTLTAARELRSLWESGFVSKEYLAIVHGELQPPEGLIDAPLGPDPNSEVAIKDCVRPDGAPARTQYRVEFHFQRDGGPFTVVRLFPATGRKHQLRIHLSHLGHPIVGDKLYGGDESLYLAFATGELCDDARARLLLPFQALHAARLWVPWNGIETEFSANPERWFTNFLPNVSGKTGILK